MESEPKPSDGARSQGEPVGEGAVPVALGLRARKGGAAVVGVAVERGAPRVVLSTALHTSSPSDRLSLEPYRVAAELMRDAEREASTEAAAVVAEGRRRQDHLATQGLRAIVQALADEGYRPVVAGLLVNRAGWITDVLAYSRSWPEHLPVAEGLAVREALRFAFNACGAAIVEVDEKSLPERAADVLDASPAAIEARLKALGATRKPWRKDQKLACLCAWLTMTTRC